MCYTKFLIVTQSKSVTVACPIWHRSLPDIIERLRTTSSSSNNNSSNNNNRKSPAKTVTAGPP